MTEDYRYVKINLLKMEVAGEGSASNVHEGGNTMKRGKWKIFCCVLAGALPLSWGNIALAGETAVIGGADGPTSIFIAGKEENEEAFLSQAPNEAAEDFLKAFYTVDFAQADIVLSTLSQEQEQLEGEILEELEAASEEAGETEESTEKDTKSTETSGKIEITVLGENEESFTYSYDSILGALETMSPYCRMSEEAWQDLMAKRGLARLYGMVQDKGQDLSVEEITLEETSQEEGEAWYDFQVSLKFAGEGQEPFTVSGQMDLVLDGENGWMVESFYSKL